MKEGETYACLPLKAFETDFRDKDDRSLFTAIRNSVSKNANSEVGSYDLQPNELVLNISEGCNLTCPYCFAGQGRYGSKNSAWMSYADAYENTHVMLEKYKTVESVKLFGGEPFMNLRAIKGACKAIQDCRSVGREVKIGTVTNMTIFSTTHAHVLKDNDIKITVSIDGPQEVHNHFRQFTNGNGSFLRIKHNIEKYAECDISVDCFESVYTPYEMSHGLSIGDVVDFLVDDFQAPVIRITPVLGGFKSARVLNRSATPCLGLEVFEVSNLRGASVVFVGVGSSLSR